MTSQNCQRFCVTEVGNTWDIMRNSTPIMFFNWGVFYVLLNLHPGGGHSNTKVVHMWDQRFSKRTVMEMCPFEKKNTPKQEFRLLFGECVLWNRGVQKMTPKHPLIEYKKDPFLEIDPFWPQLKFSQIKFSLKKPTTFSHFSGSVCVQH